MDRALLLSHLEQANRHVAQGTQHVRRQQSLIERLEQDGQDSSVATALLAQFEDTLAMHLADRDRMLRALATAK